MQATIAQWDAFYASLMEIYWPSVPPELRTSGRQGAPEGDPEVPEDLWRTALLIFQEPEVWLANPIPNLDGQTPLEVLAAGEADKLRVILMEVAAFFLPDPSEVRPWGEESGGA